MQWTEIEKQRQEIGLSRAEMCRRAGISESTIYKGMTKGTRPSNPVRDQLMRILEAARAEERAA